MGAGMQSDTFLGKLQVLNSNWFKHGEGIIGLVAPNPTGFRNGCIQLLKQWLQNLSLFISALLSQAGPPAVVAS